MTKRLMVKIYAIKNPATGIVFYVGASSRSKEMRELRLQRIMPELIILNEVNQEFAKEAEQFWINYFISLGCPLSQLKTSAYPRKHSDSFKWKCKMIEERRLRLLAS